MAAKTVMELDDPVYEALGGRGKGRGSELDHVSRSFLRQSAEREAPSVPIGHPGTQLVKLHVKFAHRRHRPNPAELMAKDSAPGDRTSPKLRSTARSRRGATRMSCISSRSVTLETRQLHFVADGRGRTGRRANRRG
jgi:hypothetical protein